MENMLWNSWLKVCEVIEKVPNFNWSKIPKFSLTAMVAKFFWKCYPFFKNFITVLLELLALIDDFLALQIIIKMRPVLASIISNSWKNLIWANSGLAWWTAWLRFALLKDLYVIAIIFIPLQVRLYEVVACIL